MLTAAAGCLWSYSQTHTQTHLQKTKNHRNQICSTHPPLNTTHPPLNTVQTVKRCRVSLRHPIQSPALLIHELWSIWWNPNGRRCLFKTGPFPVFHSFSTHFLKRQKGKFSLLWRGKRIPPVGLKLLKWGIVWRLAVPGPSVLEQDAEVIRASRCALISRPTEAEMWASAPQTAAQSQSSFVCLEWHKNVLTFLKSPHCEGLTFKLVHKAEVVSAHTLTVTEAHASPL